MCDPLDVQPYDDDGRGVLMNARSGVNACETTEGACVCVLWVD